MISQAGNRLLQLSVITALTVGLWFLMTQPDSPSLTTEPPELFLRSGGEGTTMATNERAFSLSNRAMGLPERIRFAAGDVPFEHIWSIEDGLGDPRNGNSCLGCHINNGRSVPPDGLVNASGPTLMVSLGLDESGAMIPHPEIGFQLQDQGDFKEGSLTVTWEEIPGTMDDGTSFSLRKPIIQVDSLDLDTVFTSLRAAPPVFGGGLLENIPASDIALGADPNDLDADGISGRVSELDHLGGQIGRFGWKAQEPTILSFTEGAFTEDLSLDHQLAAEIFGSTFLEDTAFYTSTVAVPALRGHDDPHVQQGAAWFEQIGCSGCHRTEPWVTGPHEVTSLAHQVIVPFTDLLLHDMGPELDDGLAQHSAESSEWRTAPLWGIGLTGTVSHEHYLHDGRARTLEEAILWHGGEAQSARDAYVSLSSSDRALILGFLEAL